MMAVSILLLAMAQTMPVEITGPWDIKVGPGSVNFDNSSITLAEPVSLTIQPPETVQVRDECCPNFPVFNENSGGWMKGVRLRGIIAEECTATGLLHPDSVKVKPAPGDCTPFVMGADYALDGFWGSLGRIESGAIGHRQTVYIDYDHDLSRIDSIFVDADGHPRLAAGNPAIALAVPPEPNPGETAVLNIFLRGGAKELTRELLYPIDFTQPLAASAPQAETLLPKTLARLRAGQTVTIVAFGDSVTDGGGVNNSPGDWYQNQFLARLKQRFPQANIRMLTAGWGGASSKAYLEAPRGGIYDFVRDVLEPKADLVTIEFVNDAYLGADDVAPHYANIVKQIRDTGAEVAIITPHLVRADWMKAPDTMFEDDPRPFVKGLREFAAANNVALADAGALWCRLRRQGLPYITLLANDINHPDRRGHIMFADALMGLFPEK